MTIVLAAIPVAAILAVWYLNPPRGKHGRKYNGTHRKG